MTKKCLIISGSPKKTGNTAFAVDAFVKNYIHQTDILNVFPTSDSIGVSSCIDCGWCLKHKCCVLTDDFNKILKYDYDLILIVSPIYQSNLPGPLINLINRFNFMYNNKKGLNIDHGFRKKDAALILVGGGSGCRFLQGKSNEDLPIKQAEYIINKINGTLEKENILLYLNTDNVPANENKEFINSIKELAQRFN